MSEPQTVRGFIVGRMPFGNTSLIVRCLSQQAGRLTGAELPLGALLVTATNDNAGGGSAGAAITGPSVWLVDAKTGALKRQAVQLLSQSTDQVRVAGLADGALVVSVGAQKLDAGLRVRPVQRPLASMRAATNPVVTR